MWHSMLITTFKDQGIRVAKESINTQMDEFKAQSPSWKLSQHKRDIIESLVLSVPESAVAVFKRHLEDRLWAKSAINLETCGLRALQAGYSPPGCAGKWAHFLKNTNAEVCASVAECVVRKFEASFRTREEEAQARKQEIQSARASK
eukprot:6496043-Alexandrium_andersonii.AAC.1